MFDHDPAARHPGSPWPFVDPPETEVIALDRVLSGESPLRLVCHDADDEGWQFLDGEQVFEEDAVVILLGEMVQFDPGLVELANLPAGWYAWRPGPTGAWQQAEGEPPATLGKP